MVKVEVRGMNQLKAKLDRLPKVLEDAVWDANFDIVELARADTVREIQSSTKHGSGETAGSYKDEVVINSNGHVVGRIWSDNPTAIYRELGTGQVGQASPKELPEGVTPVYRQTPWFIPAEGLPDLNALYGMPLITIKGKKFYRTNGQPARQALMPAIKGAKQQAPEIYKANVQKQLRKLRG
ncbi:HK97 gp10 family phage protein [Latilactobacillus sakei]|uniref:hypothetical protein n=1 Tax=Latilactobacillus sakei TaxID=1599 RepID=UPI00077C90FB|nr:hypothetical protein [Latilactobacillus sakei]MDM5043904.1 HK97 gp10 family phage protein [Latilactobacillus sakei]QVQ49105.1 HK97 gp10 family phage protein [Latilactobacillus sakei subsp. sakei]RXA82571.1 HK97 gp10 family phage protein [Latilactobacillus sakei]WEY49765.1 HK97 gp10 family phage protein [Latilactobacillus sakei]